MGKRSVQKLVVEGVDISALLGSVRDDVFVDIGLVYQAELERRIASRDVLVKLRDMPGTTRPDRQMAMVNTRARKRVGKQAKNALAALEAERQQHRVADPNNIDDLPDPWKPQDEENNP